MEAAVYSDPVAIAAIGVASSSRYNQTRAQCPSPECRARKKKNALTLSIKRDGEMVTYQCWHCGVSGAARLNNVHQFRPAPVIEKPAAPPPVESPLSQAAIEWFASRGITTGTIASASGIGVHETNWYFAQTQSRSPAISFSYICDGKHTASKLRSFPDKNFSQWSAARTFFGIDAIQKQGPIPELVIVEGEMDYLSCLQAGVTNVISVPNGAPLKVSDRLVDPSEDVKFHYLWEAREVLERAERVILFTDADNPGQVLAEELSRRIGRVKCWTVSYPEGCKDPNDVLLKVGPEAIAAAVQAAQPWPVAGLYGADHFFEEVDDLWERGIARGASTGYAAVDDLYTVTPGQLTIVTGIPSSGKSEFVDQMMVNLAERLGWKFAIASFENEPRLHIAKLMAKAARAPFFRGVTDRMDGTQYTDAKQFVLDHFTFIYQADGSMCTVEKIVERARVAVLRYGIRGLVIDPYSYIERNKDMSETEFVSDILTRLRVFAQAHGVHVWFVAHPKMMVPDADGKLRVPKGYDISGSAQWFAKADCGITIHRDAVKEPTLVEFHCWKVRFSWIGKQGLAYLVYDPATTRYTEPAGEGRPLPDGKEVWGDL